VTSTAGSFLEVAVDVPVRGEPAGVLLHLGYTVRIHEGFQVDIHGGLGLTDEAPDYIVGGGVSLRLQ
jgi:hypothetical protein